MPNWCENKLTVEGDLKDIKKFYIENSNFGSNDQTNLTFRKGVPDIPDFTYESCIQYWGTKWDANDVTCNGEEGRLNPNDLKEELQYEFNTAWSPPTRWLNSVGRNYPELIFKLSYNEPGCDYWGYYSMSEGAVDNDITDSLSNYGNDFTNKISNNQYFWEIPQFANWNDSLPEDFDWNNNNEDDDQIYYDTFHDNGEVFNFTTNQILEDLPQDDDLEYILREAAGLHTHNFFMSSMRKLIMVQKYLRKRLYKKRKEAIENDIIEVGLMPPMEDSLPIFSRGGYAYHEAKNNFENSIHR